MEDALVQNTLKYSRRAKKVLILVVMEDALVQASIDPIDGTAQVS